jgi:sigma-B regulation protein RsbU (phosphoserine phosphatase)
VIKIKSLQQRFVVFMLVPVALLLCVMGTVGFVYGRNAIIAQWEEAALLKLQRAAHHVDMRLAHPKEWVNLYLKLMEDGQGPMADAVDILKELEDSEGVVAVYLNGQRLASMGDMGGRGFRRGGMGRMSAPTGRAMGPMGRGRDFTVTEPHYNPDTDNRTVSLTTSVVSDNPADEIDIEVVLDFDYLLQDMPFTRWWRSQKTFLIDRAGHIFVSTTDSARKQIGETGDPVEAETLAALQASDSGTLRGKGHPPHEISGFYRLQEAPWYLAVFAPGEEILEPIIRFRNYYFLTLGSFVLIILLLIRRVAGQVAHAVNQLSVAAGDIARGEFDLALPERTGDEIGALTRSFNTMAAQLKERAQLRQSLDLAKEVQQNLLPDQTPHVDGLDIAGRSLYCEETGGDYFDYLKDEDALHIIVGDVAGHGISAALLMSSVRASLRQCYCQLDDIGRQVSDLNRNIAMDVGDSGRFVTLFYLALQPKRGRIEWVRAGHDPGLVYRRAADRFDELDGPGIALGVDPEWTFAVQREEGLQPGDIVMLGTDGIWEARSRDGKMFGKQKVRDIIRTQRDQPAGVILDTLFDAVAVHAATTKLADDMTMVVAKILSNADDAPGQS